MNLRRCRRYLDHLQLHGIKLGLKNVRTLLEDLNSPQTSIPSVLVAGTNGKGSVSAMLESILSGHGFRVGLYTSPHLVRVEERIQVGRRLIPGPDFDRLLGVIRRRTGRLLGTGRLTSHPTYFEVLTVLAFLYFRERKADIAVLEVGMGGRFDATNIATPLVSVITSVSRDHEEYLGKGLARIAREKAGIIKPGVPAVCGLERGTARSVIMRRAGELEAPFRGVFDPPNRFRAEKIKGKLSVRYETGRGVYRFSPSLRGLHQGRNAAVAVAAAEELSGVWRPLDKKRIIEGIESTDWPGRLELVSRRPDVVLDGCHNEDGARTLEAFIRDFIPGRPVLVFAASKDKPVRRMADHLFPPARWIILTRYSSARAFDPVEMRRMLSPFRDKLLVEPDPRKAVRSALVLAGSRGTVVVTGSLFLVGEVKRLWPRPLAFFRSKR